MDVELRLLKILEKVPPELREPLAEFFGLIDKELGERLTKKDFEAFEKRFEAFAERTEENFRRVWQAINELAEAQKKTEKRLNELAEAQKRTEERLNELAEAQKKTEERLNELAEAQKKTEERLNELAEAQKKTEEVLRGALKRLDRLEERVEGLSDTVGYTLENRAYKALPGILSKYGLKVEDRLLRKYVKVRGKERQLNIYGYAKLNGERVLILGEAKVRPSKKEISRFEKLCKSLAEKEGLPVFKIFVAHDFPPSIEEELHKKDILPIWSYDLE